MVLPIHFLVLILILTRLLFRFRRHHFMWVRVCRLDTVLYPNEVISIAHHFCFLVSNFFPRTLTHIQCYLCIIIISFKLIFQHPKYNKRIKNRKEDDDDAE